MSEFQALDRIQLTKRVQSSNWSTPESAGTLLHQNKIRSANQARSHILPTHQDVLISCGHNQQVSLYVHCITSLWKVVDECWIWGPQVPEFHCLVPWACEQLIELRHKESCLYTSSMLTYLLHLILSKVPHFNLIIQQSAMSSKLQLLQEARDVFKYHRCTVPLCQDKHCTVCSSIPNIQHPLHLSLLILSVLPLLSKTKPYSFCSLLPTTVLTACYRPLINLTLLNGLCPIPTITCFAYSWQSLFSHLLPPYPNLTNFWTILYQPPMFNYPAHTSHLSISAPYKHMRSCIAPGTAQNWAGMLLHQFSSCLSPAAPPLSGCHLPDPHSLIPRSGCQVISSGTKSYAGNTIVGRIHNLHILIGVAGVLLCSVIRKHPGGWPRTRRQGRGANLAELLPRWSISWATLSRYHLTRRCLSLTKHINLIITIKKLISICAACQ